MNTGPMNTGLSECLVGGEAGDRGGTIFFFSRENEEDHTRLAV